MDVPRKTAVAYVRISSLRQVDNESPDTQRAIIQSYADANDIEIVENGWFFDEAKSGKNADREELNSLLNFAIEYKGKIDYVLVYKLNRMSRDIESYMVAIKSVLKAKGISIRSATEPIDDTASGRLMETLLMAVGQMDNEMKAGVTKDNMRSLAMQGYWQHPPKVGYDPYKIPNESGKLRPTMKPNAMAAKVKAVLERFSEGDITKAELTRYAKEIGLHSRYGTPLSHDSIDRLLHSPEYAGYVHDRFTDYKLVQGKHEPLISVEIYERNLALMSGSKRVGEVHLKFNDDYPLKGLLMCSNCGNALYGSAPKTGSGGRSPRYHCARKACIGKVKSMKVEKVHASFEEMLHKIQPSEELLKLYKTVLIREANRELSNINTTITNLHRQLERVAQLRVEAIHKFMTGSLSEQEKNDYISNLDDDKAELTAKLGARQREQGLRESDIELAINVMRSIYEQWQRSAPDVKRRFQSMIFPQGLVYDIGNNRFGTKEISPLYRYAATEKCAEAPSNSFLVAGAGLEPATSWL